MIDFAPIARDYYQRASVACRAKADPVLEFLSTGFQLTWFQESPNHLIWHGILKPHPAIRDQFGLTREYFLIGHCISQAIACTAGSVILSSHTRSAGVLPARAR
jgi:hypothetical protein